MKDWTETWTVQTRFRIVFKETALFKIIPLADVFSMIGFNYEFWQAVILPSFQHFQQEVVKHTQYQSVTAYIHPWMWTHVDPNKSH